MRLFLLPILLFATPGFAQAPAPAPLPLLWNPTADYVTFGQDEPGYRRWIAARPWRAGHVSAFHRYLTEHQVSYVAPTWQLLRTASDWQRCGADPFEVPPAEEWPNLVQTLRFVRDYVVPAIGPVEPVSVYRNPLLNRCAGGAPESVHQDMSAIDLVPLRPTARDAMIERLCATHALHGNRYAVGLGFYTKFRFHVDSWKYRTWGRNDAGGLACIKPVETYDHIVAVPVPTPSAPQVDPLAPQPAASTPGGRTKP